MVKNLLKSSAFAVVMVLISFIASVIIRVNRIEDEILGYGIQAVIFTIASIIGLVIYKKTNRNITITQRSEQYAKNIWWFIPLILCELIVISTGINVSKEVQYYLVVLLFTGSVGIAEELFFRGIIFNLLKSQNIKFAIVVSSLLFSLFHLTNLTVGAGTGYVILQVIFAFIFGIVAAKITLISKSLFPVIIGHSTHNFVDLVTGDEYTNKPMIILVVQCCILVVYSIYLSVRIKKETIY